MSEVFEDIGYTKPNKNQVKRVSLLDRYHNDPIFKDTKKFNDHEFFSKLARDRLDNRISREDMINKITSYLNNIDEN